MFLNLLFKSVKNDPELNRVKARGSVMYCVARLHYVRIGISETHSSNLFVSYSPFYMWMFGSHF